MPFEDFFNFDELEATVAVKPTVAPSPISVVEEKPAETFNPDVSWPIPINIEEPKKKTVSYSQYTIWNKCPFQWKLNHIDKLASYQGSIHTCFGTAIHEALQLYIKTLYENSAPEADSLDLNTTFEEAFKRELDLPKNDLVGERRPEEEVIKTFTKEGKDIIKWFTEPGNRIKYFPSRQYEVVGIELPLLIPIKNNLIFKGFLDIVLKDRKTGEIKIYDLKTSNTGWNKYQKADNGKLDQLLLYKKFYAEKYGTDYDLISPEFVVLRRNLLEGYATGRVQKVIPASGKSSMKRASDSFESFVDGCFLPSGEKNVNGVFRKSPGKNKSNCKYCEFHKVHCDAKEDKP